MLFLRHGISLAGAATVSVLGDGADQKAEQAAIAGGWCRRPLAACLLQWGFVTIPNACASAELLLVKVRNGFAAPQALRPTEQAPKQLLL